MELQRAVVSRYVVWTQDEAGNHNTQESETIDDDDDDNDDDSRNGRRW